MKFSYSTLSKIFSYSVILALLCLGGMAVSLFIFLPINQSVAQVVGVTSLSIAMILAIIIAFAYQKLLHYRYPATLNALELYLSAAKEEME